MALTPPNCPWCGRTKQEVVGREQFCPRCGKDDPGVHTCSPNPERVNERIADLRRQLAEAQAEVKRLIEKQTVYPPGDFTPWADEIRREAMEEAAKLMESRRTWWGGHEAAAAIRLKSQETTP